MFDSRLDSLLCTLSCRDVHGPKCYNIHPNCSWSNRCSIPDVTVSCAHSAVAMCTGRNVTIYTPTAVDPTHPVCCVCQQVTIWEPLNDFFMKRVGLLVTFDGFPIRGLILTQLTNHMQSTTSCAHLERKFYLRERNLFSYNLNCRK
jgi:hypothetical protein